MKMGQGPGPNAQCECTYFQFPLLALFELRVLAEEAVFDDASMFVDGLGLGPGSALRRVPRRWATMVWRWVNFTPCRMSVRSSRAQ